jgi:KRAB domain-containing zinc finger protein
MLKKHKVLHEEYKFVCSYCSGKFRHASLLAIHIKINHTHIKDFVCDQCSASYHKRPALNHHIALVHMGIRYQCQVSGCTSSLSRKDAYVTHLKSHNLNESEMKLIMIKCKEFMEANNLKM